MGHTDRVRIDARANAVDVAETFAEARGGGVEVHHVGAVELEARGDVGPVGDLGKDFEPVVADVPAVSAPSLAAQRLVRAPAHSERHFRPKLNARSDGT